MRAEYLPKEELEHLLAALMPANRLALRVSLATGLRIGDVLRLRKSQMPGQRFVASESKTGKRRRVRLPLDLWEECHAQPGLDLVFPSRLDARRPRSRQAVYKDLRRAAAAFRLGAADPHITPHSARKVWAVEAYRASGGDLKRVQRLLQHEDEAVTMLYAMADELTRRRCGGRRKE